MIQSHGFTKDRIKMVAKVHRRGFYVQALDLIEWEALLRGAGFLPTQKRKESHENVFSLIRDLFD